VTGSSAAVPAGWLQPAGPDERGGLRSYLSRLVGLDDRAAVRLQGTGTVVGVWGGPPLGVLTLRPVGLAHPTVPGLDLTLSAQRLLERVDGAGRDGPVALPPPVPGPAWAGLLPPRGGWDEVAVVPSSSVHDAVRVGVEAFRRRVDLLPVDERQRPALEAVAEQVWNQPLLAGIPLRAAHAAQLTGLLSVDGQVRAYSCGPWLRLSCPGGSVALRRDGGTGLGLDLGVWALLADSVEVPADRTV
jgi:hypothetical protein